MRHTHTTDGQRGRGGVGLRASGLRQGGVGILVGLLLLPVGVMAQEAGDLDTSFGVGGKVITDFSGSIDEAKAVALQPDGKIVVAGHTPNFATGLIEFALARYLPDGTLDTTFGDNGRVTTGFGEGQALAQTVALQPDGKIVTAGYTVDLSTSVSAFALARYLPDGALDTTFSGDGKLTTDTGSSNQVNAVVLQPDGKVVAAGGNAMARYNPDGTLDMTFGDNGLVTIDFREFRTATLQPDGKIVTAGVVDFPSNFALSRYLPNGTLDTTFGDNGRVTTDFGDPSQASAVVLQPDGKIVAAGSSHVDFALARYLPDGTLDTTFSGDGRVTTDFGESSQALAVALQADGKIVAAGWAFFRLFALARYQPNGTLDTTFGGGGLVTTNFAGVEGATATANGLVIQPHGGGLVVAGSSTPRDEVDFDFAVARYHAITKEVLNMEISGGVKAGTTVFDPTPVPKGPAGTFAFTTEFCNAGSRHLTALASETRELTRGNALRNRDSGTPPAVGSILTFSANHGYTDMRLDPGECVEVLYQIGLARRAPFRFFVDVLGVAE
jgi:uncharacterized delta-60 repeat protein